MQETPHHSIGVPGRIPRSHGPPALSIRWFKWTIIGQHQSWSVTFHPQTDFVSSVLYREWIPSVEAQRARRVFKELPLTLLWPVQRYLSARCTDTIWCRICLVCKVFCEDYISIHIVWGISQFCLYDKRKLCPVVLTVWHCLSNHRWEPSKCPCT